MRTLRIDELPALEMAADYDLPPPDPLKTSWPEVVGWSRWNAALRIAYDRQEVGGSLIFLDVGQSRPPDYDATRIVVFVDANLLVALVPVIGKLG